MSRLRLVGFGVVCLSLAVLTGRLAGADNDKALKDLDGVWILDEREVGGKEVNVGNDAIFIEDGVVIWTDKKGTAPARQKAKIKVDASKDPKTIDFRFTVGSNIDKKRYGIYKFEGGKLILAVGQIDSDKRPEKFASKLSAGATRAAEVMTYKKAKE